MSEHAKVTGHWLPLKQILDGHYKIKPSQVPQNIACVLLPDPCQLTLYFGIRILPIHPH